MNNKDQNAQKEANISGGIRNKNDELQTRYIKDTYFTDYLFLMDSLINTRKDVDFLCGKQILVNYLGDNSAANSMINNLNKGIEWIVVRNDYIDLYNKLNSFYENPWHRRQATLKREYFSTPWRGTSTVAAIVLLILRAIVRYFGLHQHGYGQNHVHLDVDHNMKNVFFIFLPHKPKKSYTRNPETQKSNHKPTNPEIKPPTAEKFIPKPNT
ncbi:hypothetical protein CFP56_020700 [Quercus suber]|uniref:Uncharacterized protein n=1 Tax=Quercus suber TaxID=58331 RepID=A0AAW0KHE4_QUESU